MPPDAHGSEGSGLDVSAVSRFGARMIEILGLVGSPVGVRLLPPHADAPAGATALEHHRYCQAVMKARRAASVVLDGEGLSCPAAAAAFGFRPLPAQLASGKGLVGFGIVADPAVGRRIFEAMPKLPPGRVGLLHLFPLDRAEHLPDVVVLEDEIEKRMWVVLAYLHATGGERVQGTTAVLQAVCADSTIVPLTEQRLNFGYGCYGCREASDIGPNETVVGFPASLLAPIATHLEFLNEKAIPASRSKRALAALERRSAAVNQPRKEDGP